MNPARTAPSCLPSRRDLCLPAPILPSEPVTPIPGSSLARTVSSGSMRILKVCCCSVLSVMVTAMVGPERRGGPGTLTQHATHAAAILVPSRTACRPLPGQALRAPTIGARDRRARALFPFPSALPPLHPSGPTPHLGLSWACVKGPLGSGMRTLNSKLLERWMLAAKRAGLSRGFLRVTP